VPRCGLNGEACRFQPTDELADVFSHRVPG
jgi:hypothetical protein